MRDRASEAKRRRHIGRTERRNERKTEYGEERGGGRIEGMKRCSGRKHSITERGDTKKTQRQSNAEIKKERKWGVEKESSG